jgi:hypothetical protein
MYIFTLFFKGGFFWIFFSFYVPYSTLLHLPPFRYLLISCLLGGQGSNPGRDMSVSSALQDRDDHGQVSP